MEAQRQRLRFSCDLARQGFGRVDDRADRRFEPLPLGEHLAAAGYAVPGPGLRGPKGWQGGIEQIAPRLAELRQRRDAAAATLARLVAEAEALLAEPDPLAR